MGIIPRILLVRTIVRLYHLDSNQMPEEKERWELHKDAACCFQQILKAAHYKIATVRTLTSHFTSHPIKKRYAGMRGK